MPHVIRKNEVPKAIKVLILRSHGASLEIARRAGCSKSLVSMVLAGERNCTQRIWDAIVDWLSGPNDTALREMAKREIGTR